MFTRAKVALPELGSGTWRRRTLAVVALASIPTIALATSADAAAGGTTRLVSVSNSGEPNVSNAFWPSMSAAGHVVIFEAIGLTPNCPGSAIFARNTVAGTTTCVSVSNGGAEANSYVDPGGISADGRYVIFNSDATNLGAMSGQTTNVFVRDLVAKTTTQVNLYPNNAPFDAGCGVPAISPDGKIAAIFADPPGDLVIRNLATHTSTVISGIGPGSCDQRPALSNTGRYIALLRGNSTTPMMARLDRSTGSLVDLGQSQDYTPGISADGSVVSFASGRGLVPSDTNDHADIYTATFSGNSVTLQRVSVSTHGAQGNANSVNSALSPDSRYVAFMSTASTLVPGDTNRASDVFLRDRRTGVTTRVDVGPNGRQANAGNATAPEFIAVQTLGSGGAIVAFESGATNLLARQLSSGSRIYTHG